MRAATRSSAPAGTRARARATRAARRGRRVRPAARFEDEFELEREFSDAVRARRRVVVPLTARERAQLAQAWSEECRTIGLAHLAKCFRARASEGRRDDGDDGDDDEARDDDDDDSALDWNA